MNNFPEVSRTRIGGQMESQRLGIDHLLSELFECVTVGETPDELMGIDLPPLKFDKDRARRLVQDFLDNRALGKMG